MHKSFLNNSYVFSNTSKVAVACLALSWGQSAFAAQCEVFYAGQNQAIGQVCVANTHNNLTVTYNTVNGWVMNETHLFIGKTKAEIPQTRTGNPQVGQFPYGETFTPGVTTYTVSLPLADFGVFGDTLAVAAHAAVSRVEEGGVSNQSAWAGTDRIVNRGSWATWFSYTITEPDGPAPSCEKSGTAFAFGDQAFEDLGTFKGNAPWGWQLTVNNSASGSATLYQGAGNNDTSKATVVGTFHYDYTGGQLYARFEANSGFAFLETHLYAGTSNIATRAPGQYGHGLEHDEDAPSSNDSYTVYINGNPIYVVGHAAVCKLN